MKVLIVALVIVFAEAGRGKVSNKKIDAKTLKDLINARREVVQAQIAAEKATKEQKIDTEESSVEERSSNIETEEPEETPRHREMMVGGQMEQKVEVCIQMFEEVNATLKVNTANHRIVGCHTQVVAGIIYSFHFVPTKGNVMQQVNNYCALKVIKTVGEASSVSVMKLTENDFEFGTIHDCNARFATSTTNHI